MVVGKLLTLLAINPVYADTIDNPRFFNYTGGDFFNRLADFSFGYMRTLSESDKSQHQKALNHAVMFADNGEQVVWYGNRSSGYSMPVATWPKGNGYCRRIHTQAIAYNTEKTMAVTACYNQVDNRWTWFE